MNLPKEDKLPVNLLSACFASTSATYKYYWFLSILQAVEDGNYKIQKKELFARMISNAWYTVNYFKVSYGKQDVIQETVSAIKDIENIDIDEKSKVICEKLVGSNKKETLKLLWHFDKNVPHWFQSSWFPKMDKVDIYKASTAFEEKCLYGLYRDEIVINPIWVNYLVENSKILKDFCYWNLALFLQNKNPNVPDIPNKLIKPAIRNSLTKQRTGFWDIVIKELGTVDCIYTGSELTIANYAVEHFVPYSFVSHDLIWNLIPANKSFNSAKSDKLPPLEKYFDSFFSLQHTAIEIVRRKNPNNKFLEDYLTIFPDLQSDISKEKFRDTIQPLITIASKNGFLFMQ